MQISLKVKLAYARQIQLSIVFLFGLCMYLFTTIPHNWWIFLTIMMMMSAVQPGLILVKSINRGKGTILGIIISFILVYILHLNYRMVSVALIISMILVNIPNAKRYDLTVTAMTVMIFLSDSYSFRFPLLEGPIEVAVNRMTCTVIGIAICIAVDHFLFNRFNYSGKAYRVLQDELLSVAQARFDDIMQDKSIRKNRLVIMKHIRDSFNNVFGEISGSADGLVSSHSTNEETKNLVRRFTELSWKLRIEVSAIYVANCVVGEEFELIEKHVQKFNQLMSEARENLLQVDL